MTGERVPLPFSWSWSRYRTWQRCPRQFWLSVYEAPLAKEAGVGSARFEVWIQRNLMGRAQWRGLVAHQAVEWYVKGVKDGRRLDREGLVLRVMREARRTLELSSTAFYRGDPRRFRGLDAHYYDESLDGAAVLDAMESTVRTLLWHPVVERLTEVPERIREVEQLSRIRLWGADIWLSPDVVVADGSGGLVVVDWKTGRAHTASGVQGQLALYVAYVLDRYLRVRVDGAHGPLPLHRVRGLVAHTGEGAFRNETVKASDIEGVRTAIATSMPQMRPTLGPDPNETPPETMFPRVEPAAGICSSCSFRRTCERE